MPARRVEYEGKERVLPNVAHGSAESQFEKSSKQSCFHKRSKFFIVKRDVKSGSFFFI
jgi:hypothetical protein